ncbi:LRRNT 2 domain-containing protein [Citrus sinensis]|uniref:LRRNT 2 domain-containing protein n=1 Tax=Citrus sinensis TaxID=2711 RepID=A0ACB8JDU6_CITSI|nr:LRRNT 2 domain-containing protein [Citrus sinensis]
MRPILLLSWPFLIPFLANYFGIHMVLVSGQCQSDQQSLLLQMKNSFILSNHSVYPSTKLSQWTSHQSSDCCDWNGVRCDEAGHVIGLDLSREPIIGGLENATGLFNLQYLQSLNLGFTFLDGFQIPSRLGNLTNLTYLNLSQGGFAGKIPIEISSLTRLVTLDLSGRERSRGFSGRIEIPNLSLFLQNLTELRELHLDQVDLSASGTEWCKALSFLPNLQVLSLSGCDLSGPINHYLAKLRSLSVIRLHYNYGLSSGAEFLANLTNLKALDLSECGLQGKFPEKILQVPTLETLDLSINQLLQGSLPNFPKNSSLRNLILSGTGFSGTLPDSIGNLENLTRVEVRRCNFTGPIPPSMANLTQLFHMDFSSNHFSGRIPSLHKSRNLNYLDISFNNLSGGISSTFWEQLVNLNLVLLSHNLLNGSIPRSLFLLPNLEMLRLSNNQFENQLPELSNVSSSVLFDLDLSGNRLEGPVPISLFFELRNLDTLDLSSNKFSRLRLASSKPRVIPILKNQSQLSVLDISNNQISGEIPNWIWEVGSGNLRYLNLSHNLIVSLQEPYSISGIRLLDLHSNQLRGNIPHMSPSPSYVDYSNNNFTSIPADIGNFMSETEYFFAANNSLVGVIPESVCKATYFQVLDLSNNNLSGTIPTCLITKSSNTLGVLNLGRNNLNGTLSDTIFPGNCRLQILDLSRNQLQGVVPKSLANCNMLQVLDLRNNHISDNFPCWLRNASRLQVLVLRSNNFSRHISCPRHNVSWPLLQIVDLASNKFSGRLSQKWLLTMEKMMVTETKSGSELNHLGYDMSSNRFYEVSVTVTVKSVEIMLLKVPNIFTSIDFSSNNFEGPIPEEMGQFKSLYALNMSHNALTGSIPSSFGNLKQIESLDLSMNNLSGKIPSQLASLNFLSVLNLSYNNLVGKIPTSTQLQSFSPTSYEGNKGLYGPPLTNESQTRPSELPPSPPPASSDEIDWFFIAMSIGFAVGFGAVVSPLMFSVQVNKWYNDLIYKFIYRRFRV